MRLDKDGRDITNLTGLHDSSDCEIKITNYSHPDITSGQHTNGPYSVWIRMPDGDGEWMKSEYKNVHKTVKLWVEKGIEGFKRQESRE